MQESEERLSLAADSAEAGLWTLDYSTGVFWATERARAIFGYSPDEVISMERFEASVHPDDWDLVRGAIERSARTGEPVNVEYRILPGDGRVRWIASRGRPQFKSTGEPERLTGISIDVTEHKLPKRRFAEARLAWRREPTSPASRSTRWTSANVPSSSTTGFAILRRSPGTGTRPPGPGVLDGASASRRPPTRVGRARADCTTEGWTGSPSSIATCIRLMGRSGFSTWPASPTRDATGRTVKSYGVLRDITERKRVEDELRDLSRRLIRAHEEERALLARELHDDVTQRLAVLAIDVGRAELAAPDGAQAETMRTVREGLVRLSEDIHSLAYQLHPSVLEELGLAEALRTECERRGRQSRVDLSMEIDTLPAVIGKDAALCLFRVAQEALNNVARHAGARAASVTLRQMDGGLLLAVRDTGVGFDAESPGKRRSLGLASMRERVRLVNGTLDIESAPGRGTAVIAWVPAEGESR